MQSREFMTYSGEETIQAARSLAVYLKPGSVIRLEGDLGSGKTTFVKGIALALGLEDAKDVKSPTFVVMHVYPSRIPLYHFDLYRLEGEDDLSTIGFEEFIFDPAAVKCVEWAEKAGKLFPPESITVKLSITGENQRKIQITIPKP